MGKDVFVEWKSEHAECVAALAKDPEALAMLPQPFATSALVQNSSFSVVLDLNGLWKSINGTPLITGCAVVRADFAGSHPEAVEKFLRRYEESVEWVNGNTDEASVLIEKYGIIKAAIASKALPFCNIVCITGDEMKRDLTPYLESLYRSNPKSVGGTVPGEDFWF